MLVACQSPSTPPAATQPTARRSPTRSRASRVGQLRAARCDARARSRGWPLRARRRSQRRRGPCLAAATTRDAVAKCTTGDPLDVDCEDVIASPRRKAGAARSRSRAPAPAGLRGDGARVRRGRLAARAQALRGGVEPARRHTDKLTKELRDRLSQRIEEQIRCRSASGIWRRARMIMVSNSGGVWKQVRAPASATSAAAADGAADRRRCVEVRPRVQGRRGLPWSRSATRLPTVLGLSTPPSSARSDHT